MAPSSASRLPARPTVTAPTGCTSHRPAWRPSRQICSTTPAVSATGSVLAIACTAVKPPSAAAAVPRRPRSRRLPGPARAGACAGRPAGQQDQPVGVQPLRARRVQAGADLGDHAIARSARRRGSPPSGRAPLISQLSVSATIPLGWKKGHRYSDDGSHIKIPGINDLGPQADTQSLGISQKRASPHDVCLPFQAFPPIASRSAITSGGI